MIQTQYNSVIKILRTNNSTDFTNHSVMNFLTFQGTIHQTTYVYTPQQNNIMRRRHKYIVEVARELRFKVVIPLYLWVEYVLTAVHIINRLFFTLLWDKSSFEIFFKTAPSLDHLRVFGCLAYAVNVKRQISLHLELYALFS